MRDAADKAAPHAAPGRANLIGIMTMASGNALLVVNDTFVKLAASQLPLSEVIALRAAGATLLLFCAVRFARPAGPRSN